MTEQQHAHFLMVVFPMLVLAAVLAFLRMVLNARAEKRVVIAGSSIDLSRARHRLLGSQMYSLLVVAPIAEESTFRLIPLMMWPIDKPTAIIWGVMLNLGFSAIHYERSFKRCLQRLNYTLWVGFGLLGIALSTGSVLWAIFAHFSLNAWSARNLYTGAKCPIVRNQHGREVEVGYVWGWDILSPLRSTARRST